MIEIINHLTSTSNAIHLEKQLLDHPWFYLRDTAYNHFTDISRPYESSWVHMLYNEGQSLSPLMPLAESLLVKSLDQLGLSIEKLIRIRAGLCTRVPHEVIHAPHTDWDDQHMTAIYYVNDSDGDTVFYKEKRDESLTMNSREWAKNKKFTVDKTITPKADTMVIFDGLTYHSSTAPQQADYRITLNFNWLP